MRKIAYVLILLLVPIVLAMSTVNTVHAATMTGTYSQTWTETGSSSLPNGTSIYYGKDTFVYKGAFSGSSAGNETDYSRVVGGTFRAVENFTGSFNASQQGALTFQDEGWYLGTGEAGSWATSFSGGTGGLAGLHGTMTVQYPGGTCNTAGSFCTFQGTYTVTSASWVNPVPEFSNITLPIVVLFTTTISLAILKRRRL